jgi:hypothetical protein
MGAAVKFEVVTVANGRVFLGSGDGDPNNFLVVYGLVNPPTAPPAVPSTLAAEPVSSSQINLSWIDNATPPNTSYGFYVEQSLDGNSHWTQIAATNGNSYSVGGLSPDTTYYFRIRAYNSAGNSDYTLAASATTTNQGYSINYSSPAGFANYPDGGALLFNGGAAVIENSLLLTEGGINERSSAYTSDPLNITAFTTSFTYVLGGTQDATADGMTFVIQNQAPDALGNAGGSLGYGGITPSFALAIDVNRGLAGAEFLTNGMVDSNYSQTNINTSLVNVPITVTINYYGGNELTATLTQAGNTDTLTYRFESDLPTLLGGSTAWVGFTASTGDLVSFQKISNWTFAQLSPPDVPGNLLAQLAGYTGASTASVPLGAHLTWTAAAGAAGYKLERKLTAGGSYSQIGASNSPNFDDTGLTPGSTYYYRVRATNAVGDGAYSAEIPIVTPSLPATPNGQQITGVTTTSISFSWTNNANNADGYQILRQVGGNGFVLLATIPPQNQDVPGVMTYTDSGLTPGTHYDYHIQSYNLAGYSDFAGISTPTLPTAPTNLQAIAANQAIGLTWTTVSGVTYNVYRGTTSGGEASTPYATGITTASFTDSSLAYNQTYYYTVTAVIGGVESASSNEASAFFAAPPTIGNVQINDGSDQRSEVWSITVTFSGPVTFTGGSAAAAFQLTQVQSGVNVGLTADDSTNDSGQTVVTLTFSGPGTDPISTLNGGAASLADGRYELTIFGSNVLGSNGVALDGTGSGAAGSNYVSPTDSYQGGGLHLYRLYGDANGDGVVDTIDLAQFRSAYNTGIGDPSYLAFLDADNSGANDTQDLGQFRSRQNANVF